MGYTHYWEGMITEEEWNNFLPIVNKIMDINLIPIRFELDDSNSPLITNKTIQFNGLDDKGHETFFINVGYVYDFCKCKTARKPYDDVVVAILMAIDDHTENFSWRSDDDKNDHVNGKELYDKAKQALHD